MPRLLQDYPRGHLSILTTTTRTPPITDQPYLPIKNKVLGAGYDLTLTFVGEKRIQTLNKLYRKKDTATDILSFPLDTGTGEIFICPEIAKRRASRYERELPEFLVFLFIHGCFHLKGFTHGGKMERNEAQIRDAFNI